MLQQVNNKSHMTGNDMQFSKKQNCNIRKVKCLTLQAKKL